MNPADGTRFSCIADILKGSALTRPSAPALLAPGRQPLTFAALCQRVDQTVLSLKRLGLSRHDRIAVVVPQGPELAVALLAAAGIASCVPLSPAARADEFAYFFSILSLKALLVQAGIESHAREIAQKYGLLIIDLFPCIDSEAGTFDLRCNDTPMDVHLAHDNDAPGLTDEAFVLVTSGTTSQPKVISLPQRNVTLGAISLARCLDFTPQQRLLGFMPMHFSAGLNETLRVLTAGGSVICPSIVGATQFWELLDEFQPTFCTATTSVFRAILATAPFHQDALSRSHLHFLRSASMAMPPQLQKELEQVFGVPVIQSYGSTETGLIATNMLPPHERRLGSVGQVVDAEVAVIDDRKKFLPTTETGEIIVRGPRVIAAYERPIEFNQTAFWNGWYRTGDEGYLDADGYLYITGRLKEAINRSGEKISPYEIEDVVKQHPAVEDVAIYGIPDRHVGEEVAAAVVPKTGAVLTEKDLQQFVLAHLHISKVPRQIAIVDTLPRTVTGKLQRVGLAERFAASMPQERPIPEHPLSDVENQLILVWAEVLKCEPDRITVNTHFRDLGGDSLKATQLVFRAREKLNVMVTLFDFFATPTIGQQAAVIEKLRAAGTANRTVETLIPIRTAGAHIPLFCLHALDGGIYFYETLVPYLHPEQPVYGLQAVGMDGTIAPLEEIDEVVDYNIRLIRSVQPHGPFFLAGYSYGGTIALEVARKLRDEGHEAAYPFLIDSHLQVNYYDTILRSQVTNPAIKLWQRVNSLAFALFRMPMPYKLAYFQQKTHRAINKLLPSLAHRNEAALYEQSDQPDEAEQLPTPIRAVQQANTRIGTHWVPRPYYGPITFIRASDDDVSTPFFRVWGELAKGPAEIIDVSGHHRSILREPIVGQVAEQLQQRLDKLRSE